MTPSSVGNPIQWVAVDILGPLPISRLGNKYVMVTSDYFTKWAEAYALPDQTAKLWLEPLSRNGSVDWSN